MDYFNSLGDITYRGEVVTNLIQLMRIDAISEKSKKEKKFRTYVVADGETPEMISNKLYDTKKFWWLVVLTNGQYSSWWTFPVSQSVIYDTLKGAARNTDEIVAYQDLATNEYADRFTFDQIENGSMSLENDFLPITLAEKLYKEQDEKRIITVLDKSQLPSFLAQLTAFRKA